MAVETNPESKEGYSKETMVEESEKEVSPEEVSRALEALQKVDLRGAIDSGARERLSEVFKVLDEIGKIPEPDQDRLLFELERLKNDVEANKEIFNPKLISKTPDYIDSLEKIIKGEPTKLRDY